MPKYAKFLKEMMSKKRRLDEVDTVNLHEQCSVLIQRKMPEKRKDPGSFTIPCTIGNHIFKKSLCDLGASINFIPTSIFEKLNLGTMKPIKIFLQLAHRTFTQPRGIVEDVLVKVDKFIFSVNFMVLDMEEDRDVPLIMGRPFVAMCQALIDIDKGSLTLRVNGDEVSFNVPSTMQDPNEGQSCKVVIATSLCVEETLKTLLVEHLLERCLIKSRTKGELEDVDKGGSNDIGEIKEKDPKVNKHGPKSPPSVSKSSPNTTITSAIPPTIVPPHQYHRALEESRRGRREKQLNGHN